MIGLPRLMEDYRSITWMAMPQELCIPVEKLWTEPYHACHSGDCSCGMWKSFIARVVNEACSTWNKMPSPCHLALVPATQLFHVEL